MSLHPRRSRLRRRRAASPHRAFVIIAVLVIVMVTLLVATGALYVVQADRAGSTNLEHAAQARLLAWSGLQIIMDDLRDERDRTLDGERPRLDEEFVVYSTSTRLGVVRLLPVGPGDDTLLPEAGKLDLNSSSVDAAMLVATELVDEPTAQRIIDARETRGGFRSVADLLAVDGVTAEGLWGPLDEFDSTDSALGTELGLGERVSAHLIGSEPRGLADVITVHAVEPLLQRSGDLRISLRTEWSEELGRRLDDRYGEGASGAIKGLFDQGERFEGDERICQLLNQFDVEIDRWPDFIDGLTGEEGVHVFGRLDLNTAPEVVLAAIPSIGAEAAAHIVDTRDTLSPGDKATIEWPAREEILELGAYDELGGMLTTRCWTWRLRLAAGEVDVEDSDGPLSNPVIWEVVIDLADPAPRLAYLRDITLLQTAAHLVARADPEEFEDDRFLDRRRESGADGDDSSGVDFGPATLDDLGGPDDVAGFDDLAGPDDLMDDTDLNDADLEDTESDDSDARGGATSDADDRDSSETAGRASRRIGRWISRG